jgi:MYXO-CTERM domain-containing protein
MANVRVSGRRLICAAGAVLVLSSAANAVFMPLATGPDPLVDGYLMISPDDYGSWAHTTFGGGGDLFNPAGALGPLDATFTSGFFLFTGGGRELLSDNQVSWQDGLGFSGDGSLNRSIIAGLTTSDTNGDGIDDMATSSFAVTGGPTNLRFELSQRVVSAGGGVSYMQQDYTVTNNGSEPIDMNLVRVFDGDLLWDPDGDFGNDEVGTTMHGAGLGTYVFEQDASDPSITAITLSSLAGNAYFGAKRGVDPGGAGLPYDYGTDTEVWDNFGMPANWVNHIAGVGYNTNGVSGTNPPGSGDPADGYVGLGLDISLGSEDSMTFTVYHTYGQNTPIPTPGALALLALAGLGARRRRR